MRLLFALAMLLAGLASPAMAQETVEIGRGANDIPIMPYLLQLLAVTGVVAALAFFSVKFLKDKAPGLGLGLNAGKQVKVVDKVVVDPKRMVFVVNVGNRYWLLAATENHVTPVAELSKQDLGGDFAQLLEQEKVRGEML